MLTSRGCSEKGWFLTYHHGSLLTLGLSHHDFIGKKDFTLHYASFDQALALVSSFGTGALMAKLDLKLAFHLCPVSPSDRDLLGMHWQGKFYVDLRLPFSRRSSLFLFNRLANAFERILKNNYAIQALVHYLVVYFTVGLPLSPVCASQVHTMVKTADRLGFPLDDPPVCITRQTHALVSLTLVFFGFLHLSEFTSPSSSYFN